MRFFNRETVFIEAAPVKQADIQGPLQRIVKEMERLKDASEKTRKMINFLKKIFVEAAVYKDKQKVLKDIEKKVGLLRKTDQELRIGRVIVSQLERRFEGTSALKAVGKVKKEALLLLRQLEENAKEAVEALEQIAGNHLPAVLANDDPIVQSIFKYLKESIDDFNKVNKKNLIKNVTLDIKKPITRLGYANKNTSKILRFVRFFKINHMPHLDETGSPNFEDTKTVYIALAVNMSNIQTQDKSYGTKISGVFSKLELYAVESIRKPESLVKGAIIARPNSIAIEKSISYESQKLRWVAFSEFSRSSEQIKLAKSVQEILGKKGVKLTYRWPNIKVSIPTKYVEYLPEGIGIKRNWWERLFYEVLRVFHLPKITPDVHSRGIPVLTQTKSAKTGDNHVFTFVCSPISPTLDRAAEKAYNPSVGLSSLTPEDWNRQHEKLAELSKRKNNILKTLRVADKLGKRAIKQIQEDVARVQEEIEDIEQKLRELEQEAEYVNTSKKEAASLLEEKDKLTARQNNLYATLEKLEEQLVGNLSPEERRRMERRLKALREQESLMNEEVREQMNKEFEEDFGGEWLSDQENKQTIKDISEIAEDLEKVVLPEDEENNSKKLVKKGTVKKKTVEGEEPSSNIKKVRVQIPTIRKKKTDEEFTESDLNQALSDLDSIDWED